MADQIPVQLSLHLLSFKPCFYVQWSRSDFGVVQTGREPRLASSLFPCNPICPVTTPSCKPQIEQKGEVKSWNTNDQDWLCEEHFWELHGHQERAEHTRKAVLSRLLPLPWLLRASPMRIPLSPGEVLMPGTTVTPLASKTKNWWNSCKHLHSPLLVWVHAALTCFFLKPGMFLLW